MEKVGKRHEVKQQQGTYRVRGLRLNEKGQGLAQLPEEAENLAGLLVFVDGLLPEDEADIQLTEVKKTYAQGRMIKLVQGSPLRVHGKQRTWKEAAAMPLINMKYEEQLKWKKNYVFSCLERYAHWTKEKLAMWEQAPLFYGPAYAYRHKLALPCLWQEEKKELLLGAYLPQSHEIIESDLSLLHCPAVLPLLTYIRQTLSQSLTLQPYLAQLRHLQIRSSHAYQTHQVIFVVTAEEKKGNRPKQVWKDFFSTEEGKAFLQGLVERSAVSVYLNDHDGKTNQILGKENQLLVGEPFLEEKLLDRRYTIGPYSFFQINPSVCEAFFAYIREQGWKMLNTAEMGEVGSYEDAYLGSTTATDLATGSCLGSTRDLATGSTTGSAMDSVTASFTDLFIGSSKVSVFTGLVSTGVVSTLDARPNIVAGEVSATTQDEMQEIVQGAEQAQMLDVGKEALHEESLEIAKVSKLAEHQANSKEKQVSPSRKILDFYCGVGTLGLLFTDPSYRRNVELTGVELVEEAVLYARQNARLNQVEEQCTFFSGKAEAFYRLLQEKSFDLLLLDPPRKGCETILLEHINQSEIPYLIYVSCNPQTLARDLQYLDSYEVKQLAMADFFPHTPHVECVVLLTKVH